METLRLTTAEAIVRFLIAQRIVIDGVEEPLFPGVIAIFGHGNVVSLGHALEMHRDELPVWRGQNEQGMGLAMERGEELYRITGHAPNPIFMAARLLGMEVATAPRSTYPAELARPTARLSPGD